MGISKPPVSMKKYQTELEHIPQEHFVRKSETHAVEKPKDEPKFGQDTSFSIGDNTFHYNEPQLLITSSYSDTSTIHSFQSVEDAIANGKDSDLVAMPVRQVREMRERISILEREVMKSYSNTSAKQKHNDMIMEAEKKRIMMEQKIREHERATDLKRMELEKAMLSRKYQILK